MIKRYLLMASLVVLPLFSYAQQPDPKLTPGVLCTKEDPHFYELRYPEKIPYCKRHITHADKQLIAGAYGGIPEDEWDNYEFDHLIPLAIGGSNNLKNLWPQPLDEAHDKDKVEVHAYHELHDGKITQQQAVDMIWKWVKDHPNRVHSSLSENEDELYEIHNP